MGFADGSLVALNASDGSVKWEKSLSTKSPFTDVDTSPELDDNGILYAASYRDGLYALEAETGQQKWHVEASGMTGIIRVGEVLFVSGDGQIAAYWSETGTLLWSTPFKGRATRTPVMAKGKLVFPLTTGLAFADPATGVIKVEWDPGNGVSATPLWSGSRLYVLSNMGFLYSMRL
jgi:outer membrane protein assembly factor BamB